jgi:hypothetical protein
MSEKEDRMIFHSSRFGYTGNFKELFAGLNAAKEYVEQKYPTVTIELMYGLDGERGKAYILTRYESMGDYESISAALDDDEKYGEISATYYQYISPPVVDRFFKGI